MLLLFGLNKYSKKMKDYIISNKDEVIKRIKENQIMALPAESCFGLSALVNEENIQKIQSLKNRAFAKGFILVADCLNRFERWVDFSKLAKSDIEKLIKNYHRATTWLVPLKKEMSSLVNGQFDSIAIRITRHAPLVEICQKLESAIISTSANLQGEKPAETIDEVIHYFGYQLGGIWDQPIGIDKRPSQIISLISGEIIRQ